MDFLQFQTIPANSILLLPEQQRNGYLSKILKLPKRTRDMLFATNTGSYITGLAKSYDIDTSKSSNISLIVLKLVVGEKTIMQLPAILSSELQLPMDKAQNMASEIEKDILGPVKAELDEFLSGKVPAPRLAPLAQGKQPVQNLLDLKEIAAAKRQELLTARPKQQALPPAPIVNPARTPLRPQASRGAAREGTTPAPKFPLPARTPMPPKPPTSPLSFTGY